jgi:RNA polymerase sigma factor (sigma-70 family)
MLRIKSLFLKGFTDEELLEKFRSTNDSVYFGELFKRYSYVVLGTCKKYLHDREKAKDAVMQVFEKLLKEGVEAKIYNFSSWLHVVSRNHCLMKLRKEKHLQHIFLDETLMEGTVFIETGNQEDPEEHYHNHLEGCFKKLNAAQQKCVDLFYLKENPYKAITAITGFSLDQVKSYVQNGKRNLKICLEGKVLK